MNFPFFSPSYYPKKRDNLLKSVECFGGLEPLSLRVKSGSRAEGEVISVNMAFLKAGTPYPAVSWNTHCLFPSFLRLLKVSALVSFKHCQIFMPYCFES